MISIIKINNINYKGNCSPIHGPITGLGLRHYGSWLKVGLVLFWSQLLHINSAGAVRFHRRCFPCYFTLVSL